MRNIFKSGLVLACALLAMTNAVNAATNASSTVTGTVPILNTVQTTGGTLTIGVDVNSGQLSGNMSTGFSVFTNNSQGVIVQFDVTTTTSAAGSVNASTGTGSNSNTGKVVLANSTVVPTAASINNALAANPSAASNANAITYQIQFTSNKTNVNPLYASNSATTASVKAPVGTTVFTAQISNSAAYLTNTYDNDTDNAGSYQASVNCTISSP